MGRERIIEADHPPRHVASLDGIRAICCICVIGHHFGFPLCQSGWIGVEMFFVLSGFLITTLLYREHRQIGSISLLDFWARRAFRLFPAYWLYAGFVTAVALANHQEFKPSGSWTLTVYLASIWAYFINFAPSGLWSHQLWTSHLWSLAKEEQFYFCWPVLLFLTASRIGSAWTIALLISIVGIAARIIGLTGTIGMVMGYIPLGISAGCAVGLWFARFRELPSARRMIAIPVRWMLAIVCVVLLIALQQRTARFGDDAIRPWAMRVIVPLYVFPFALLVASMWYGEPARLDRALGWKPLAYIGTISYGIYLYHMVLILPVKSAALSFESHTGVHLRFAIVSLMFMTTVVGVASLSYYLMERPLLQIGKQFRPRVSNNGSASFAPAAIDIGPSQVDFEYTDAPISEMSPSI